MPKIAVGAMLAASASAMGATALAAGAIGAIGVAGAAASAMMSKGKSKQYDLPTAQVPAAPAPTRRTDTGANVAVGTNAVKNQRVSGGGRATASSSSSVDILSGLGSSSGLSI